MQDIRFNNDTFNHILKLFDNKIYIIDVKLNRLKITFENFNLMFSIAL